MSDSRQVESKIANRLAPRYYYAWEDGSKILCLGKGDDDDFEWAETSASHQAKVCEAIN